MSIGRQKMRNAGKPSLRMISESVHDLSTASLPAKPRIWSHLVKALVVLLCLQTQSHGDSSLDIKEASDYFFSLPVMNFGAFFYVGFPNNTLDQLYECLCNIRIIQCSLIYSWFTPLNTGNSFPYYYTVSNLIQVRAPDHLAVEGIYSDTFLCDSLLQTSQADLNCRRLQLTDNTCEVYRCLKYSIQTNATTCSTNCAMLNWAAEYDLKVVFFNFGDYPEPVKDGVCPEKDAATTPAPSFSSTRALNVDTLIPGIYNGSSGHLRNQTGLGQNYSNDTVDRDLNVLDSSRLSLPIPIMVGAGAGGVIILVVVFVVYCKCIKSKKKDEREGGTKTDTSSNPSSSDFSNSSSELSKSDCVRSDTTTSISDDLEKVMYHTLDEMAGEFGHQEDFDVHDEQGYNIIPDWGPDGNYLGQSRARKSNRPLPQPPTSGRKRKLIPSESSQGSRAGQTPLPCRRPQPCIPRLKQPGGPLGLKVLQTDDAQSVAVSLPPPRPHQRLVDIKDHSAMGLVKLRPGQDVFCDVTDVKLIRTRTGNLELVSTREELPAFVEYYTRLLLINQTGGSLGIVGSLDPDTEPTNDYSSPYLQVLPDVSRSDTPEFEPVSNSNTSADENIRFSKRMGKPISSTHLIYFGSVKLNQDVNLDPCDYLTVLDIDPNDFPSGSDGYLTVWDLEEINVSTSSYGYLDLNNTHHEFTSLTKL